MTSVPMVDKCSILLAITTDSWTVGKWKLSSSMLGLLKMCCGLDCGMDEAETRARSDTGSNVSNIFAVIVYYDMDMCVSDVYERIGSSFESLC